jgi:hypothetical protein
VHPPSSRDVIDVTTTRRPTSAGYWGAALIAVLGLLGAAIWGAMGAVELTEQVDAFARVEVPGEAVLTVEEPADLTIFYEAPGIDEEQAELPPLTISILGPDGDPVAIAGYGSELTYHLDDHVGRAIATFSAAQAGDHRVVVEGEAPPEAILAFGEGVTGIVGTLVGAGLILFVTFGAGAVLALVTASRRRKLPPPPPGSPEATLPPPPVGAAPGL